MLLLWSTPPLLCQRDCERDDLADFAGGLAVWAVPAAAAGWWLLGRGRVTLAWVVTLAPAVAAALIAAGLWLLGVAAD